MIYLVEQHSDTLTCTLDNELKFIDVQTKPENERNDNFFKVANSLKLLELKTNLAPKPPLVMYTHGSQQLEELSFFSQLLPEPKRHNMHSECTNDNIQAINQSLFTG